MPASRAVTLRIPAPGRWIWHREQGVVDCQLSVAIDKREPLLDALDRWMRRTRRADVDEVVYPDLDDAADPLTLRFRAPEFVGSQLLDGDVPLGRRLHLLEVTARAIDAWHARGVIHGGLGLDSLWGDGDQMRFPDVGLADALADLWPPTAVAGVYAAPEQRRVRLPEPASDVYALAVIAHELLSGAPRSQIGTPEGLTSLDAVMLEPARAVFPGAPPAVTDVLARALSASPVARYATCALFITALHHALRSGTPRVSPTIEATAADRELGVSPTALIGQDATRVATAPRRSAGVALLLTVGVGLVAGIGYGIASSGSADVAADRGADAATPTSAVVSVPRELNDQVFVDDVAHPQRDSVVAVPPGLHDIEWHRASGQVIHRRLELRAGDTVRLVRE